MKIPNIYIYIYIVATNILLNFYRLQQFEGESQVKRKTLYLSLYLLIWGEAANLRFMPECLCYLFRNVRMTWTFVWLIIYENNWFTYNQSYMQMAQDLNQILLGEINGFSSAGDDKAFLRNVVTPIYQVIKQVCHPPKITNRGELDKRVRIKRKMHFHSSITINGFSTSSYSWLLWSLANVNKDWNSQSDHWWLLTNLTTPTSCNYSLTNLYSKFICSLTPYHILQLFMMSYNDGNGAVIIFFEVRITWEILLQFI